MNNPSFWNMKQCSEYFPLLKELGLEVISCHVASENLNDSIPEICRLTDEFGVKQIVVGTGELSEEAVQERAFLYRKIADILMDHNAELLIHNGKPDIAAKIQGRTAYEYLVDICLGKVFMQFARLKGIPQFIDADTYSDVIGDAGKSYWYLMNIGQQRANTISYLNIYDTQTGTVKLLQKFDGKHIWFISTKTGLMQLYRMNTDGSNIEQMTFEEQNNWFGHVSPDCKTVVNLAYKKGHLKADEHLPNMQVELWMMDYDGTNRRKILEFFGGQGSLNVNSWSSDSHYFAFVSYDIYLG